MTEDEMVGWHHQLNGHEFEQTQGDSERQRSLACYSPWGHNESDTTQQLNNNNTKLKASNLLNHILLNEVYQIYQNLKYSQTFL